MAAHVLRLRFDLLLGALRGDGRRRARGVLSALGLAALAVLVSWGLLRLRGAADETAMVVTVVAGAAVALGFLIAPLVVGADDLLDPRRFGVFGAEPAPLAFALLPAAFVSVPVLALVVGAVASALMWTAHGVDGVVAVLSAVLAVVTCVLLSRVAFAVSALVLRERRSRELTGLFLVGVLVIALPVVVFLASLQWGDGVPVPLVAAVEVLAVTPLGAAWALPAGAVGLGGAFVVELLIALATPLLLLGLWVWLVRRLLTTIERPLAQRGRRGLGWFAVMPGTATGVIAARSLTYWLRDPRYLVNIVIVPIAAVITMVPLLVVGVPIPVAVLVPVPLMALFLGWLPHNDLAYDSTALWLHVAASVRGAADRAGRLVPIVLLAVPLLAVTIPVAVALHGQWSVWPALVGVCASLFLTGLGLSCVSSVLAPYAASRPGDGAFQQPQRTGGGLAQGVVLVAAIVLSAPTLWGGWLALGGDVDASWATLWTGLGTGVVVLALGIALGGVVFRMRSGKLMEFVEST
ncbi:hypothetical protein [Microbacterium telephonicum]|uniref:ABC-2 type transport system permease protein n=1 Tax=Microbacterium telephonicum TaxID=1714841 RepID=A0A498C0I1_9MICO|nr:hypothetical protein [Microbacterium telephonicum]RLK49132.1 ABC-2 type transport system permease protein [Microbacterium telephonicum]